MLDSAHFVATIAITQLLSKFAITRVFKFLSIYWTLLFMCSKRTGTRIRNHYQRFSPFHSISVVDCFKPKPQFQFQFQNKTQPDNFGSPITYANFVRNQISNILRSSTTFTSSKSPNLMERKVYNFQSLYKKIQIQLRKNKHWNSFYELRTVGDDMKSQVTRSGVWRYLPSSWSIQ